MSTLDSTTELEKAALQGSIGAIHSLAFASLQKKEWLERWKWLKLGEKSADPYCLFLIGESYLEGLGNPIDRAEGFRFMGLAAELEFGLAQYKLYQHHSNENEPECDQQLALNWLERASSNKIYPCHQAKYSLARHLALGLHVKRNQREAVNLWHEVFSRSGETDEYTLACAYAYARANLIGFGIRGEWGEAIRTLQFGASHGDAQAGLELAKICIEKADAGVKDPYGEITLETAYFELNIAAALGHELAVKWREVIAPRLTSKELQAAQSASRLEFDEHRDAWIENWSKLKALRLKDPLEF